MKISVKTLGGSKFDIEVNPDDRVYDVKKNIETVEGLQAYPASQQILIHRGKVLKDDTTLNENNVAENNFIVIMLTKAKSSTSTGGSTTTALSPASSVASTASPASAPTTSAPTTSAPTTPVQAPRTTPVPAPTLSVTAPGGSDVYGEAASNLVVGSNLEGTIQELLEVGGGMWDRDIVARALRAAFNNPERAVDYLYSGIPEQPDLAPATQAGTGGEALVPSTQQTPQPAQAAVSSGGPNANPLDLFPQGLPNTGGANAAAAGGGGGGGNLEFLRNNPQFEAMRAMVQANPQILESMLEELGKQNPQILNLIQEHPDDFINLLDEPAQGEENMMEQLDAAMPQQVAVTREELEAIERLEGMGFDRAVVLQVFFACNKNEEVAANYLLDHGHEFD